jgi:hypothetical protein
MTTLTLLTKAYNTTQLSQIDDALRILLEGLDAEAKAFPVASGKYVQITLAGEDESIAANYIAKEIGFCPTVFEKVRKFSALRGWIVNLEKNREELSIDVGVFQPKIINATVPLRYLQAQLVDGRKIALKKIGELFGFCENLPLSIKIVGKNEEESQIEAELSYQQVEKYIAWREALLDKLLVLGVTLRDVENELEHAKLNRDVINVEPLGLFEQALTCKLGTDATGLIPKIGRALKNAKFAVFNPRNLRNFLEV